MGIMTIVDRLEDIGFWIMLPTVRLTEKNPSKTVRVLGVLAVFPLYPLLPLGLIVLFAAMVIDMYQEI